MLKRDLVDEFAAKHGITKAKSREMVDDVFDLIQKGLQVDRQVKISGFGTIEAVSRKPRTAKNPQTGKAMEIQPGYRIRVKVSKKVKDAVDQGI